MQLKAAKSLTALITLSLAALQFIRGAITAHTLQAGEEFRQSQPNQDSRVEYSSIKGDRFEKSGRALALGVAVTDASEKSRVVKSLQAVGTVISDDSAHFLLAAFKATEGYNVAMQASYKRSGREYVPIPHKPAKPQELEPQAGVFCPLLVGLVLDDYIKNLTPTTFTPKIKRCL